MSELSPMFNDVRFCNKIWEKTKTSALSTVKKKKSTQRNGEHTTISTIVSHHPHTILFSRSLLDT